MTGNLKWEAEQEKQIVAWLKDWNATAVWNSRVLGPRPESAECRIPARLFRAAGVQQPGRTAVEQNQPAPPVPAWRERTGNADHVTESADRMERRADRTAAEAQRMAVAKLERAKTIRGRVRDEILHEGGRTRLVKRVSTTAERLVASGKINRGLKSTLETFATLVAEALGCATVDEDDATSRLTSQYEPSGGSGYGPRSISDRRLDALEALRKVRACIPPELVKTFTEVAAEEVGSLLGRPRSLEQIGQARGYLHKQASAAGGVEVAITIELIVHLVRQLEGGEDENRRSGRMSQERPKPLTYSGVLEKMAA